MAGRRSFLIAGGTGIWMLVCCAASFAQPHGKVWRIGVLHGESRESRLGSRFDTHFFKRLAELGYVEGRNLVIDRRFADGLYDRLDALAAELVRFKPDVIVVSGTRAARASQEATRTIPIVSTGFGDPVGAGLAESLSRPGGNVTGLSNMTGDIEAKRLELLMSAVPAAARVAQLVNPDNPTGVARIPGLRAVAQKAGKEFSAAEVRSPRELEGVFARMVKQRVGAIMVPAESSIAAHTPKIAQLALQHKLPSIFGGAFGAESGGLIGYGPAPDEPLYRAAVLVDKIFKGANPGDLPIEQPTTFELVVNLKTAKTLGIKIPQSILVRADRVIE